ncbi:MAG: hypothetical protein ACFB00_13145 [Parvularculaceae bacterium]
MRIVFIVVSAVLALGACGERAAPAEAPSTEGVAREPVPVDAVADAFVRLGLGLGLHDENYVDAYQGDPALRADVEASAPTLDALRAEAERLLAALDAQPHERPDARAAMLRKQIVAAHARIRMAQGETLSFDEETRLLYDAVAPSYDLAEFDAALEAIEALLPGEGALSGRVSAFRESLAIPGDRLSAVFDAAIAECRKRTLARYDLPQDETFRVGYVTDKPWGGYNWYQGGYESLIEVNTDLPVIIDRAVDLGCHEGYPGHHTWNVLAEKNFLNANGWSEYAIFPLFSPQALILEGSANYGIELAFSDEEKTAFERDVLFPLAGLDPAAADDLAALNKARRRLSHARNHVAREYLDGRMDADTAVATLMKYSLVSRERAEKSLSFIETYRGYVINYNLGRDLVEAYVERAVAAGDDPWAAFEAVLTRPVAASDLAG